MKTVEFDLNELAASCRSAAEAKLKMAERLIREGFPVKISGSLLEPEVTLDGPVRVMQTMEDNKRIFTLFEDGDIIDD